MGFLCNADVKTAIGLGDELASIVDQFGEVDSRKAKFSVELEDLHVQTSSARWSQSLSGGCLPVVLTDLSTSDTSLQLVALASGSGNEKADYWGINSAKGSYRIKLSFPYTTSIEVCEGMITSGDEVLAIFPPTDKFRVSQAKYNCMTPQTWSLADPPWGFEEPPKLLPGLDAAFSSGRAAFLSRWVEYRFPVSA